MRPVPPGQLVSGQQDARPYDDLPGGELRFSGRLAGALIAWRASFEQQLEKCGVDYFDFYLLHNLCETSYDLYTDEDLGLVEYLLAQKAAGRIRYLGFSAHGRPETIEPSWPGGTA